MTSERRHAILTWIAAQLENRRAEALTKQYVVAYGRMAPSTVCRVFQGRDHRVSTLLEIADALDCDVKIEIVKRSA